VPSDNTKWTKRYGDENAARVARRVADVWLDYWFGKRRRIGFTAPAALPLHASPCCPFAHHLPALTCTTAPLPSSASALPTILYPLVQAGENRPNERMVNGDKIMKRGMMSLTGGVMGLAAALALPQIATLPIFHFWRHFSLACCNSVGCARAYFAQRRCATRTFANIFASLRHLLSAFSSYRTRRRARRGWHLAHFGSVSPLRCAAHFLFPHAHISLHPYGLAHCLSLSAAHKCWLFAPYGEPGSNGMLRHKRAGRWDVS